MARNYSWVDLAHYDRDDDMYQPLSESLQEDFDAGNYGARKWCYIPRDANLGGR